MVGSVNERRRRGALVLVGQLRSVEHCFESILAMWHAQVGSLPSIVLFCVEERSLPATVVATCTDQDILVQTISSGRKLHREVETVGSQYAIWFRARVALEHLATTGIAGSEPVLLTRPDLLPLKQRGSLSMWDGNKILHGIGYSGHFPAQSFFEDNPELGELRPRTGWNRIYFSSGRARKKIEQTAESHRSVPIATAHRGGVRFIRGFPDQLFLGTLTTLGSLTQLSADLLEVEYQRQIAVTDDVHRATKETGMGTTEPHGVADPFLFRPPTAVQALKRFERRLPVFVYAGLVLGLKVKPLKNQHYVILR